MCALDAERKALPFGNEPSSGAESLTPLAVRTPDFVGIYVDFDGWA